MKNNTKILSSLFQSENIPQESKEIIENFDSIIQNVRPLNSKQIQQLPDNIRELSHQLTDQRSTRRVGYMNDAKQLSSYVRYYTWWNLVRLTKLFSNLPQECFPSKECFCLDIGTGPLTVITALWLARPELRKIPFTWYCLDVSATTMTLGEDIFLSIVAKTSKNDVAETPWKIIRVKGSFGTKINKKVGFLTCANVLNELDQTTELPPEAQTKKYFEQFLQYSEQGAKCILVEPGVPKAARTLSLLRYRFLKDNGKIFAPCTHAADCPMNGFKAYTGSKNKWCNFAFSTEGAPSKLLKLSQRAKLPKERATLSFIAAEFGAGKVLENENQNEKLTAENTTILARIVSDEFSLPFHKSGNYACTENGLVLISHSQENQYFSGQKIQIKESKDTHQQSRDSKNKQTAKTAKSVKNKTPDSSPKIDSKSGALIIEI